MIELAIGMPGNGKSLFAAKTVLDLLQRNYRWFIKSGEMRKIYSNMPISQHIHDLWPGWIVQWNDVDSLIDKCDIDIIFDEVANKFDSREWLNLPASHKEWLRHHDKVGVEIYANTQHFEQVDVTFRRLINRLYVVSKLIGSPRPSPTKPPVKKPWGVILLRQHEPKLYSWEGNVAGEEAPRSAIGWPSWFYIRKELCDVYDTRFKIPADDERKLRHVIKNCATCGERKVVHM